MLSKVLSKASCADCRFCCSFRRQSLWETPLFAIETVDKLEQEGHAFCRQGEGELSCGQMDLSGKYQSDDPCEEAACYFLDSKSGCTLDDADKPFDCKIWPLRIMKKDDKLVIALTPTCPSINKQPYEKMKELVESGLGETIYAYAKEHPFIVKEYREGFPVLMEFA